MANMDILWVTATIAAAAAPARDLALASSLIRTAFASQSMLSTLMERAERHTFASARCHEYRRRSDVHGDGGAEVGGEVEARARARRTSFVLRPSRIKVKGCGFRQIGLARV